MDVVIKSCLRCRNVFAKYSESNVCEECTDVLRRNISVIKKAVERDSGATPEQIAEATGLAVTKVKDLIHSRVRSFITRIGSSRSNATNMTGLRSSRPRACLRVAKCAAPR
jgi:hypothetical protein